RGIEWAILTHEVRGEGTPLPPYTNGVAIRKLVADPTGHWLAASYANDHVAVWDVERLRMITALSDAKVIGGFVSPEELLIDSPRREVRFQNLADTNKARIHSSGRRLHQATQSGGILVISPRGDVIVTLLKSDSTNAVWSYNLSADWPTYSVGAISLSPDGNLLAFGLFKEIGAHRERWLGVVNTLKGALLWKRPSPSKLLWLVSSHDGAHFLANVGGWAPTLYRFDSPEPLAVLRGHSARVQDAAFSRSNKLLATAGADQSVRVWEIPSGKLLSTIHGLGRPLTSIAWVKQDQAIAVGDDTGSIQTLPFPEAQTRRSRSGFFSDVHGDIVFSENELHIAVSTTTNTVTILNTDSLEITRTIPGLFQPIHFSITSNKLYGFSSDWSVSQFDLVSGKLSQITPPLKSDFTLLATAVSHDNDWIAVTSRQGNYAIIDLKNGTALYYQGDSSSLNWAIAISRDSEHFWTGSDRGLISKRARKDCSIIESLPQIDREIQALAISHDGRWIAASSYEDASVRIWDRNSSKWLPKLTQHRRFVQSLVFTPDGRRLISGGADGRAIVWRIPEFDEIAALELDREGTPEGDEGLWSLRLSNSGLRMGALSEDGRLQIWRANSPR
ncbi:MAG: hypothetical protein IT580_00800, partial [Verrucomicrobiales bacterium]|nr:hypothetical protein [Verrucomicrobiales bacterium]